MTIPTGLKFAITSVANVHRQGTEPNIFLFATARGGSTWVMELIASQPGMKYYDEPFNIRRANVVRTGLFPTWEAVMPDTGDTERVISFLEDLKAGRHRHMNPTPFRRHYRFFTNRIVFKIHELEHLIGAIARRCNGLVLYLLRHPIPLTLSRYVFPRLQVFAESAYYANLIGDTARLKEIRRLAASGSHLQRGLVSWCYENLVPLKYADFDALFVTYEELVLNPIRSCDLLSSRLHLPDRPAMLRAFDRPASNVGMSTARTVAIMSDEDGRRRRSQLVTKWLSEVSPEDQTDVTHILNLFGLDVYDAQWPLARRYLHFDDTEARLRESGTALRSA